MGRAELTKAIRLLDRAMDEVRLLPLIQPLAYLRATLLDELTAEESRSCPGADRALVIACQALAPLCGGDTWALALPGALRRILTAVCASGKIVFSDAAEARGGCSLCQRRLRAFQTGEAVLTPLLQYYGPEIAEEEKRAYAEQLSILQTVYTRHLLLYRCMARAEVRRQRERYTKEAEETLHLLPTSEELHRLADRRRQIESDMEEKFFDFCNSTDNAEKTPFIIVKAMEGGERDVFHSGLEPRSTGPQPQPPYHGHREIPAEPE